jgi:two-component system chemotaxis response regulator CheB
LAHRDLIVIGTSAGGIEALQQMLRDLPPDFPAAVLIVVHTSPRPGNFLARIVGRAASLPVVQPNDWTPIENGKIYIAPPDLHLIVSGNILRTLPGPRENLYRPAIDPLFRSAAIARGPRVVGVILTGLLDDGTSGLMVVNAHHGAAIVQDPRTAMFPDMPQNAIDQVPDARILPLEKIAGELVRLVLEDLPYPAQPEEKADSLDAKETRLLEQEMPQIADVNRPGKPSPFGCPECGGVLWEIDQKNFLRFRCRVGHAYTAAVLNVEQHHATEVALWSALRALEESAGLHERMADRAVEGHQPGAADRYRERAESTRENAKVLREFLTRIESPAEHAPPRELTHQTAK